MNTETKKWIVGTGIGIVGTVLTTGLAVAALLVSLIGGVNARIDALEASVNTRIDALEASVNTRIDDLRDDFRDFRDQVNARMDRFDTRLRSIEVAVGKIDQRLLLIERVVLPTPEPEPPADE